LPVDPPPSVKFCALVVWSLPSAVKKLAPLIPAERDAVGMPELTLVNANRAEAVALDPRSKSCVWFL